MSILIKSMAMPDNCYECRFMEVIERCEGVEQYICLAHLNRITDLMKRLDTCPLVELPREHGDLVDRDNLLKIAEDLEEDACKEFEFYACGETDFDKSEKVKWRVAHLERIAFHYDIADADVIIPAERSEDEELKPCPICGGKAILVSHPCKRGISPYNWWVKCCNGCICTEAYTSDHDAKEMWNSIGEIKE